MTPVGFLNPMSWARTNSEDKTVLMEKEEQTKICIVRAFVEKEDPSCKDVDDPMIRRFLRARDLDVERACAMLLKYLKWRQTFVPNGCISESEIPNEIAQNKVFVQGFDKKGQPIGVTFAARHVKNNVNNGGIQEFKRFVVYSLDKLCARMPPEKEKFLVIADFEGWGYSNSDVPGYIGAISILQDYYPERLEKLYMVHPPSMFTQVWKLVQPLIDNKTKNKIVFVDNKKVKSTLLENIEESELPEIYGGKLPLVPAHNI